MSRKAPDKPFWRSKTLEQMSEAEWESLCDGCARCCLVKLEDEDSGEIHFTDIGCKLLDAKACRCLDYKRRRRRVRDCVKLTPEAVHTLTWLPKTCAYRLVAEGRDLYWWHPLVSGSPKTVHEAGVSVRGRVSAAEDDIPVELWPERIVKWPNRPPRRRK
ncbi:MAG TPA: YcgN family cysteine cluster protein [Roseiarcus sp.]|nr:YcgN family cysteine cluster protein [Roseiarcus sp.]